MLHVENTYTLEMTITCETEATGSDHKKVRSDLYQYFIFFQKETSFFDSLFPPLDVFHIPPMTNAVS